MRDFIAICRQCAAELQSIDIPISDNIEFKVNKKALSKWGDCTRRYNKYSDDYEYIITISFVLLDERNDISCLKETIMHELAHTCPNCMNHKEPWKNIANRINETLGYHITRESTATTKGVNPITIPVRKVEYKYQINCITCGNTSYRQRSSEVIKYPFMFRCNNCGGDIEVLKLKGVYA